MHDRRIRTAPFLLGPILAFTTCACIVAIGNDGKSSTDAGPTWMKQVKKGSAKATAIIEGRSGHDLEGRAYFDEMENGTLVAVHVENAPGDATSFL